MIRMTSEEIRENQLKMLLEFQQFCMKNKLKFQMAYGSLLGVVRHHGFIPWDNDIDVIMPRNDYDILVKLLAKDRSDLSFVFYCYENQPFFLWTIGKIYLKNTYMETAAQFSWTGLSLDIFILDDLGNDYDKACQIEQKAFEYEWIKYMCYDYKYKSLSIPKYIPKDKQLSVLKMFIEEGNQDEEYWVNKVLNLRKRIKVSVNSKYVGCIGFGRRVQPVLEKTLYNTIYLPFEGHLMPVPEGYDEILTKIYGDYMTPHSEQPNGKWGRFDRTIVYWI